MARNPFLFKNKKLYNTAMVKKSGKRLPKPTLKPLYVEYCNFTKEEFVNFIDRLEELVGNKYEVEVKVAIEVSDYDSSFENASDLTKTINRYNWAKLKEIKADFYIEKNKDPTLRVKIGNVKIGYDTEVALKVEMGFGEYDKQLALRESVGQFLTDQKRDIPFDNFTFGAFAGGLFTVVIAYVTFFDFKEATTIGDGFVDKWFPVLMILFTYSIGWIVIGYILSSIHRFVFPKLELLQDSGKTRWITVKKVFAALITLFGIILAVVASS